MSSRLVGSYEIVTDLDKGGMATICVARHVRLGHAVAIKFLHPQYHQDQTLRMRFLDEARIQANLRHPNILHVQDIIEMPDRSGMVMELLTGTTLSAFFHVRTSPLSSAQAVTLFVPLVDALSYAHESGVIHRDLKPSNVFLHRSGTAVVPKLMDFGIAKLHTATVESQMTAAGSVLGTPQYMAPEQFEDSSRVDARADLFAMGAMLYEALVGEQLAQGKTLVEIMRATLLGTFPCVEQRAPSADPELAALVARCLRVKPAERFQSARELRDALLVLQSRLGSSPLDLADVPEVDLEGRGVSLNTPITSSAEVEKLRTARTEAAITTPSGPPPPPAAPSSAPSVDSLVAAIGVPAPPTSPEKLAGEVAPPAPQGMGAPQMPEMPVMPGAGRSWMAWLFLVGILALAGGAGFLLWRTFSEKRESQGSSADSETASSRAGEATKAAVGSTPSSETSSATDVTTVVKKTSFPKDVEPENSQNVELFTHSELRLTTGCEGVDSAMARWVTARVRCARVHGNPEVCMDPSVLESFGSSREQTDQALKLRGDKSSATAKVDDWLRNKVLVLFESYGMKDGDLASLVQVGGLAPDVKAYLAVQGDVWVWADGSLRQSGLTLPAEYEGVPPGDIRRLAAERLSLAESDFAAIKSRVEQHPQQMLIKGELAMRCICRVLEVMPQ